MKINLQSTYLLGNYTFFKHQQKCLKGCLNVTLNINLKNQTCNIEYWNKESVASSSFVLATGVTGLVVTDDGCSSCMFDKNMNHKDQLDSIYEDKVGIIETYLSISRLINSNEY